MLIKVEFYTVSSTALFFRDVIFRLFVAFSKFPKSKIYTEIDIEYLPWFKSTKFIDKLK